MVGPNDNDYVYIDFKDFKYEPKWEFPRENLELGVNPTSYTAYALTLHMTNDLCRPQVKN